jgi:hypothetical protein
MASATAPRESELIACEIRYTAVSITCNGHEIELSVVDVNELHTSSIEESIGSFLEEKAIVTSDHPW